MRLSTKNIPCFGKNSQQDYLRLKAASLAGDLSALNAMGIIKQKEEDFVAATSLYYMALLLFKKIRPGKKLFAWEEKNRNILEANTQRALLCVKKSELPQLEQAIENIESEYEHVSELFGVHTKFEDGLKYSLKSRRLYLGHFSKYAPFISFLLVAFVLKILSSISEYYPDGIVRGADFYKGMYEISYAFFIFFIFIFPPIVSPSWTFAKLLLWMSSYYLAGGLGEKLVNLLILITT